MNDRMLRARVVSDSRYRKYPTSKRHLLDHLPLLADHTGCLPYDADEIKNEVFRYDDDETVADVCRYISELIADGEIRSYQGRETNGRIGDYLCLNYFFPHQDIRFNFTPKYPLPEWLTFENGQLIRVDEDGRRDVLIQGRWRKVPDEHDYTSATSVDGAPEAAPKRRGRKPRADSGSSPAESASPHTDVPAMIGEKDEQPNIDIVEAAIQAKTSFGESGQQAVREMAEEERRHGWLHEQHIAYYIEHNYTKDKIRSALEEAREKFRKKCTELLEERGVNQGLADRFKEKPFRDECEMLVKTALWANIPDTKIEEYLKNANSLGQLTHLLFKKTN